MNARIWTCLLLLCLSPRVAPAHAKEEPEDPCNAAEEALGSALADLAITAGGTPQPIGAVRLRGLTQVDEPALWARLGGQPPLPMDAAAAARVVLRLRWTGLFARVTPSLAVDDGGTTLDIGLEEQPGVRDVAFEGVVENDVPSLRRAVLAAPEPGEGCVGPPHDWLARLEDGQVRPGLLWGGTAGAKQRALAQLRQAGYRMAAVEAEIRDDARLVLRIDEGRMDAVEIRGIDAEVIDEVRRVLALEPGRIYVESDGRSAIERVRRRFPFVTSGKLEVDGRTLVVDLRTHRHRLTVAADEAELLRHTRHTGYSPGLTMYYWDFDPQDRFRFLLAGQANVSFSQGDVEWILGPRLQIPRLGLAELGAEAHDFTDTGDRWRMSRLDSYLDSLFGSGRRTDYYRRRGWSAFATAHLDERFTAGVEYRRDRYGAPGQALDPGTQGSLVLRGEWSSHRADMTRAGNLARHTEVSLVRRHHRPHMATGFDTVNTVEIAKPSLGSDPGVDFVRAVSDNAVTLATGRHSGLRLRARFAGGDGVPARQQEGLGGWSALRGYRYKELRGEYSWLGTAEYRLDRISAFVDVGSVRQAGLWTDPKVGLGAKLHLGDDIFVAAAWRLDDAAKRPLEIRLFFKQAF